MAEVREFLAGWSTASIVIRLVAAVAVGTMVGIDRGAKRRGAGIKTYALVCLGSALVMLTGMYIYTEFDGKNDIARLGAQVISGVGFLGVGTIMVTGHNKIKGLTTAAGLWACACLGLAIGIGFVDGAVTATILIFVTLKLLAKIDGVLYHNSKYVELYIEFNNNKSVPEFIREMRNHRVKISGMELGKSKVKGAGPNALLTLELHDSKDHLETMELIRGLEGVQWVEEL